MENNEEMNVNITAVTEAPANLETVDEAPTENPENEKKTRTKKRSVEELAEVSPRKMSDAEKIMYINSMRENSKLQEFKIAELTKSCQQFSTQFNNADTAYKELVAKVHKIMATFDMHVSCFAQSMHLLTKEGGRG